jgi:pimeloyl-ACP methyl ester carboxylesterase
MNAKKLVLLAALPFCLSLPAPSTADAIKGYQAKAKVSAPTRIDWTVAVANQSVAKPPADWLGNYDSTKQMYEVFVPANYNAKQSYPVVLFISAGAGPGGWKEWEAVCKKEGVIFASPYGAGNDTKPEPRRHRIVLDVLDDLRRNYNVDPDRTYITGHSGGARAAGHIAFALPEYFGGVIPSCAGVELPEDVWLRQRIADRLSVAMLTGDGDFNRGECERFRGPILTEMGVRTKVWVAPKTGHTVPAALVPEAFKWVEADLPRRRALAKTYPASRVTGSSAPSRADSAKLLLAEGKERLKAKETLYSGLMQLQGCMKRWPDLPAGTEAKKILSEYEDRKEKPWEAEDIIEQRKFLTAMARGLSDYATGPLPDRYAKDRKAMAKEAINLWLVLHKDNPDSPAGQEAKKRVPALVKIAEGKD